MVVMGAIRLEQQGQLLISHWPTYPTVTDVDELFAQIAPLLESRRRAIILNALNVESAPIATRDAATGHLKRMDLLLRRQLIGQATVLSSVLVRGALAAIHLVSPPGYPAKTFSQLEPAIRWTQELCEKERKR